VSSGRISTTDPSAPDRTSRGCKELYRGQFFRGVKNALVLVAALLVVVAVGTAARAELWCGRGPGTPLDHPCSDEDTEQDPAVAAAVASHTNEWMMVHGVWRVSAGTIQTGNPLEITVYVEPSQLASAEQQIPSEIDDIPVRLVAKKIPTGGRLTSFSKVSQPDQAPYDPTAAERQASARLAEAVYGQTMREYGEQWNDLPGVVSMGPKKCDEHSCDFSAIRITVQAQFMNDVKGLITDSVNGIPIVFVPYNGRDQ
jgi:hypothetical protein